MITNLDKFEQISINDVFKLNNRFYTVMCCSTLDPINARYIIVSSCDDHIIRHYNPMTLQQLTNKILSDTYSWEYMGNRNIYIKFRSKR